MVQVKLVKKKRIKPLLEEQPACSSRLVRIDLCTLVLTFCFFVNQIFDVSTNIYIYIYKFIFDCLYLEFEIWNFHIRCIFRTILFQELSKRVSKINKVNE